MPARMDEYLDKVIENRFSVSLMSNSKWRKVFTVLDVPELMLKQCYWKFVDNDDEFLGWFTKSDELMEKYVGDYGSGPFAYKRIEWLEIPKVGKPSGYENVPFKHWHQDIDGALSILNSIGQFDTELTGRGLRIYGFREYTYNKAFKSDSATRASFASLTVWHALRHALTRRYDFLRSR
ncbi:hypothetical protein NB471_10125 [Vibrio alginolyticus]|uniref:DUF6678 family protein n=2 Tax=Vibrio harveyi group TaxID=717610 RepID=UPI00215C66A8|nr:DUF6678 family protein [Vibrio alginolyticus]MCR9412915.1 hypothetical protein [Vibrio alginolyticus]